MKFQNNNINLLIIIGILIVLNLFSRNLFSRFDLTEEKRYSLSGVSQLTADSVDYPMFFTVFLEGDFPPNVRVFQEAIRTTLIELQQYAHGNIQFEFISPEENPELRQQFMQAGFQPVPVQVRVSDTEMKQQLMWPLINVLYRDREVMIDLLKGTSVMTERGPQVSFFKAESDLEYKLVSAMRKLMSEKPRAVALLQGHGELTPQEVPELLNEIQASGYAAFTFDMKEQPGVALSPSIEVLIVLQPTLPFSERDKYEIDQYLMRGGSILWIMDKERIDMDVYERRSTTTFLWDNLNLDDMFMNYGVNLKYDLVQDLECEPMEFIVEGVSGGNIQTHKWFFHPLVFEYPNHPIARNVDLTLLRYASSIDTFQREGIKHEVFLTTSPRSRALQGQQFINVDMYINNPPSPALFNQGRQSVGVVSKGIFNSLFLGREAPTDSLAPTPPSATFGPQNNPAAPGTMAIIADGEFPLPKMFRGKRTGPNGLPYNIPHDNKILVINTIDYLAGDIALTDIRSKEVVARTLSGPKIQASAGWIRWVNIAVPILLIVAFGIIRWYLRKRKHASLV